MSRSSAGSWRTIARPKFKAAIDRYSLAHLAREPAREGGRFEALARVQDQLGTGQPGGISSLEYPRSHWGRTLDGSHRTSACHRLRRKWSAQLDSLRLSRFVLMRRRSRGRRSKLPRSLRICLWLPARPKNLGKASSFNQADAIEAWL